MYLFLLEVEIVVSKTLFFSYRRISGPRKDFDFDPCLMEIMIVGYVIDIRQRLGDGEWVFAKLNGTQPPKISELIDRFGLFAQKNLINLLVDFPSYVKNCLAQESSLLEAALHASSIRPRPVKSSNPKPKEENLFQLPSGEWVKVNDEILTLYFQDHPEELKDHDGLVNVAPVGILNQEEELVGKLLEKLLPYQQQIEAELEEAANQEKLEAAKRKRGATRSRKNKKQKTSDDSGNPID